MEGLEDALLLPPPAPQGLDTHDSTHIEEDSDEPEWDLYHPVGASSPVVDGHEEHQPGLGKDGEDGEEEPGEQQAGHLAPQAEEHGGGEDTEEEVAGSQDIGGHREGDFGLNDPPELDGEGDPVEEGRGEAEGDGGGEEGAAAPLQHRHRRARGAGAAGASAFQES